MRGFQVIAELPQSDSPWRLVRFGELIILANGTHTPRLVHPDGTIEILTNPPSARPV